MLHLSHIFLLDVLDENVNKGARLGCECLYENKQTENLICFIRFCRRWHRCSHWGLASSGHQH